MAALMTSCGGKEKSPFGKHPRLGGPACFQARVFSRPRGITPAWYHARVFSGARQQNRHLKSLVEVCFANRCRVGVS